MRPETVGALRQPAAAGRAPVRPVDEVAGAARFLGALVEQLTAPVRDTHRAVSDRVFGVLGVLGVLGSAVEPVRVVHNGISSLVYASIRGGARLSGVTAGVALSASRRDRTQDRRPISAHPGGALGLAFVSGVLGEWLDGRASDLSVRLGLTQHGRLVRMDVADLPADLPGASDRLVVLVHGLVENTASWQGSSSDEAGHRVPSYAERLAEVGWTPLEVGYNSGLPVGRSGADLAGLLERVLAAWPVPVSEVALIGHSMGGLVIAAACATAQGAEQAWIARVSHVVTLGTPHHGSWLAQLTEQGADLLRRLPETRGVADVLDLRSAGIRDLTHGWHPDASVAPDAPDRAVATLSAALPNAHHTFVGATLGRTPSDALSRLLGDGLVHLHSATGPGAAQCGPNVSVRLYPGVGHLHLLRHPGVADDLVARLGPRSPRAAPAADPRGYSPAAPAPM